MGKSMFYVFVLLFVGACSSKEVQQKVVDRTTLPIIPQPASFAFQDGNLEWSGPIHIRTATESQKEIAGFLKAYLDTKNLSSSLSTEGEGHHLITFVHVDDTTLNKEAYRMLINDQGIRIEAREDAGLFYGVQSLIQIAGAYEKEIPYMEIEDAPRFSYRGLHLDVGRHFFPADFIKKYIDLLAHHKFNRFHWHLTEDQGWRIEIKKFPKLQETAAYRDETVIGHATTRTRSQLKNFDGKRYGGYYTQEEIRDIVKYAQDRYVTIIPEIELPGHALAALSAYPTLGCTGGPYKAATTWGVFDDVYCAGKEETFHFLEGVLDEVVELFPSEYIHIGGDECPKTQWEKCPHCKKRMKNENLKDTHELQSYFIQRIEKYLNSKGRQIIGWDEILEGGLAPNATVMSWRGEEGGIAAAKQHHDVIMTPVNWCYFDYYQAGPEGEPLASGNMITVEKVYGYEPVPPQLNASETQYVLGAQANLWTEYVPTTDHAEYMVYPRACAMAEVVWSPKEKRNYDGFLKRMKEHAERLDEWDVNYAKHILTNVEKVSNSAQ